MEPSTPRPYHYFVDAIVGNRQVQLGTAKHNTRQSVFSPAAAENGARRWAKNVWTEPPGTVPQGLWGLSRDAPAGR
jgi:hypothetical protein